MLLTRHRQAFSGFLSPFWLVSASFRQGDGLVALGAFGVALVFQKLRKSASRRPRSGPESRPSKRVQVLAEISPVQSIEWGFDHPSSSRSTPDVEQIALLDEILPLDVRHLWSLIFDKAFQQSFHDLVRDTDCHIGDWHLEGSDVVRRKEYVHPVKKTAVGPSEAFTEENSQCLCRSDTGFTVDIQAYTRKVPYGKAFHVELMWEASRLSDQSSRLSVKGGVAFEKKLLLGNFIKKAAHEGMVQSYLLYKDHLWEQINRQAAQGRFKSPKASQKPSSKAPSSLRRLDSAQLAKSVEDLIKNGIFVPWTSVLKMFVFLYIVYVLYRLSFSQNGRLLAPSF